MRDGEVTVDVLIPIIVLIALAGLIYYLGSGSFGRAQTQAWIDQFRRMPRLYKFLNRHHGKFRAAMHYVEFGGLFLVLYWLSDVALGAGNLDFRWVPAAALWLVCALAALLDEYHQLQSGTRQFRRVDFLHSCCGITIALAIVYLQAALRGMA